MTTKVATPRRDGCICQLAPDGRPFVVQPACPQGDQHVRDFADEIIAQPLRTVGR